MDQQTKTAPLNLTLANIQHLDGGKAALAFNQAVQQIVNDLTDRPADKTVRKIVLTVEAKPVLDKDSGVLDTVEFTFKIDSKLPKRQSHPYPMLAMNDGRAVFQPHSPFDPRQQTFQYPEPTPGGKEPAASGSEDEYESPPHKENV